jgi:hypothetical protein
MWQQYEEVGRGLVRALADLGERAEHVNPNANGPFYPNTLRFPDGVEVKFAVWVSTSPLDRGDLRFVVEVPKRVVHRGISDEHLRESAQYVRDAIVALRAASDEDACKRAEALRTACELVGTPLRAVAVGSKVCVALDPVEATEEQVRALRRAVGEIGLAGKAAS